MKPNHLENIRYEIVNPEDNELINKCDIHQFEVFSELGYQGEGPTIIEVSDYPSRYYAALENDEVVGCVRMVTPSTLGFTTLNWMSLWTGWAETTIATYNSKRCEEILFSTVKKGYRKMGNAAVILNLYKIVLDDALNRGIEYWFTSIDEKLFPYFTMVFNFKFEQIGEPQDYLGAPTIPAIMRIEEGAKELKKADPELAEFLGLTGGVG